MAKYLLLSSLAVVQFIDASLPFLSALSDKNSTGSEFTLSVNVNAAVDAPANQ